MFDSKLNSFNLDLISKSDNKGNNFRYLLEYLIYHLRPFTGSARDVKGEVKPNQTIIEGIDAPWESLPLHFKNGSKPK